MNITRQILRFAQNNNDPVAIVMENKTKIGGITPGTSNAYVLECGAEEVLIRWENIPSDEDNELSPRIATLKLNHIMQVTIRETKEFEQFMEELEVDYEWEPEQKGSDF